MSTFIVGIYNADKSITAYSVETYSVFDAIVEASEKFKQSSLYDELRLYTASCEGWRKVI